MRGLIKKPKKLRTIRPSHALATEIKARGKDYNGYFERVLKGRSDEQEASESATLRVLGLTLLAAATPRVFPRVPVAFISELTEHASDVDAELPLGSLNRRAHL